MQNPDLQALIQSGIANQQQQIAAQKERIAQMQNQPQQQNQGVDLTPLMALADAWGPTRSNLAGAYQSMRQKDQGVDQNKLQALQQQLMQQEQGLIGDQISLYRLSQLGKAKAKAEDKKPSVFEKEKMKALGKAAVEFETKTKDQLLSNVPKIDNALAIMQSNPELTGNFSDKLLGSTGLSMRNEDSYLAQQDMQSAITDTLRPTLGAQFTEKEGERVMNLTFDPAVSTKENGRRARLLRETIMKKVRFQQDLFKYISENNGSDSGFDYSRYGMEKISSKEKPSAKGGNELEDLSNELGL